MGMPLPRSLASTHSHQPCPKALPKQELEKHLPLPTPASQTQFTATGSSSAQHVVGIARSHKHPCGRLVRVGSQQTLSISSDP